MEIVILYGQSHNGTTHLIAKSVADRLQEQMGNDSNVTEFFFPKNFSATFCRGCAMCFTKGESFCPDFKAVSPIVEALDKADIVILSSPTYCFGITGPLKAFLDHTGYMWMDNRPKASMFKKTALVISAAGGEEGATKTKNALIDQVRGWGISNVIAYHVAVRATKWEMVPPPIKEKIQADIISLSSQVAQAQGDVIPDEEMQKRFFAMQAIQKNNTWNPLNRNYWESQGWLEGKPW